MLKKRIIGVVNVLNGWAVQSFSYKKYLPLGKPECLVENLDRWGADEILIQSIHRSRSERGPDFELLEKIGKMCVSTPLTYAGGITTVEEATSVVQLGADRIVIDSLLHDSFEKVEKISQKLGAQALIASVPLRLNHQKLEWFDHRHGTVKETAALFSFLKKGYMSELLLVDYEHEGSMNAFNSKLLEFVNVSNVSLIPFGGVTEINQIDELLSLKQVSAIASGNSLAYEECRIQKIKDAIDKEHIRRPHYFMDEGFL